MQIPDLKPCPFCGEIPKIWNSRLTVERNEILYTIWRLSCPGCGCSIPSEESQYKFTENGEVVSTNDGFGKLVEAWNRRAMNVQQEETADRT